LVRLLVVLAGLTMLAAVAVVVVAAIVVAAIAVALASVVLAGQRRTAEDQGEHRRAAIADEFHGDFLQIPPGGGLQDLGKAGKAVIPL